MHVEVRTAGTADATAIAAIYAPVVRESTTSFEESPPDAARIVERMLSRPRLPWLVAEVEPGCVAGYAYATQHRSRPAYRWSAECSVYVGDGHRSLGVGRALYDRLIEQVRALGYVSAYAGIALPNQASVALHEAVGFRAIGVFPRVGHKFGAWHDVGWWHLQLVDPPGQPAEPREWAGSPAAPGWTAGGG